MAFVGVYCRPNKGEGGTVGMVVRQSFLGCQLSWILRPFFGNPNIEVTFLREDALGRSFYEDVWVILQGFWAQIS